MWVIYKGEKALVVAPFLNYVTISINGAVTDVHYSQIEEDEPKQIDKILP